MKQTEGERAAQQEDWRIRLEQACLRGKGLTLSRKEIIALQIERTTDQHVLRLATVREIAEWLENSANRNYSDDCDAAAAIALKIAAKSIREKYGLDEQGGAKS